MPKGTRRSKGSDKSAESDLEKEITEAEADVSGTTTATTENPDDAPVEQPRPTRRRGGAQLRVVASGPADEVRESLAEFGGADGAETQEREEEVDENQEEMDEADEADEKFIKLLSSPKYFVKVTREMPRKHLGHPCSGNLPEARYNCPASYDDIKADVFERFGGQVFIFTVYPNKPSAELQPVHAITVRNMDEPPKIDGKEIGVPDIEPTDETAEIPMEEDDNDPLRKLEASMAEQARAAATMSKLKMSRRLMKEMSKDDDDPRPTADPEVVALKKRLADMDLEQRTERRLSAFEDRIMQALEAVSAGKKGAGAEDGMLKFMLQMQQASQQQFQTMMTAMMGMLTQGNKKHDDLDTQLERLAKLKTALGDGNPKVKSIEEKLMNIAFERLLNGDDGGGIGSTGDALADVAKTAIKEMAPVAKTLVENRGQQASGPSQEDFKRAVAAEAARLTQSPSFKEALVRDLAAKGLVLSTKAAVPGLPAPAAPAAQAAPQKKAPEPTKEDDETVEEENDLPASPQSPNYDRKAAVDFVLNTITEEMTSQPEDGYSVGDILDRLDDELLQGLLNVNAAEDLQKLIGPFADPEKLAVITNAAKTNPLIQEWISRVILQFKKEYRAAMEKAGEKERTEVEAQPQS